MHLPRLSAGLLRLRPGEYGGGVKLFSSITACPALATWGQGGVNWCT